MELPKALVGEGERVAQRKAGENGPGRFDFTADAPGEGHGDGGDAGRFDDALDQSDGLVADASGEGQQRQVHLVLLELPGHLGRGAVHEGMDVGRQDVAHEGVVSGADRSDLSLLGQVLQSLDREDDVDVPVGVGVVVVVVADDQVGDSGRTGDCSESGIAGLLVGSTIAAQLSAVLGLPNMMLVNFFGGIVGAVLLFWLFDWGLIVLSSIAGAGLIVNALGAPSEIEKVLYLGLMIIGIATQTIQKKRMNAGPPSSK